jgi:protein-disulfide isomerase
MVTLMVGLVGFVVEGGCDKTKPVGSVEATSDPASRRSSGGKIDCGGFCQRLMGCGPDNLSGVKLQQAVADCQSKCAQTPAPPHPEGRILAMLKKCVSTTKGCADFRQCAQKAFQKISAELEPQKKEDPKAIYKVPVKGAPAVGAKHGLVTVVGFLDAECGYCARGQKVLDQALKRYPKTLKVVFRDFPLRAGSISEKAAQAALAVYAQKGSEAYWAFQNKVYGASGLSKEKLARFAAAVGADSVKIKKAISGDAHKKQLKDNLKLGARFGVQGTPNFFVNGKKYPGYVPFEQFAEIVKQAAAKAKKALESGVAREKIYQHLTRKGHKEVQYIESGKDSEAAKELDGGVVFKVPVEPKHPQKGPRDALVTVVVFSDFQCPFSRRMATTLEQLTKAYPTQVRLVFRNLPLPMHPRAFLAAESSLVVRALKGKKAFWLYHDKLFQNQDDFSPARLEALAKEIGVSVKKYRQALAAHRFRGQLREDLDFAERLSINGSPQLFINGKPLGGAQPYAVVKKKVDAELAAAKTMAQKLGSKAGLYAKIIAQGKTKPVYAQNEKQNEKQNESQ